MKKSIVVILAIIILVMGALFFWTVKNKTEISQGGLLEQTVLEKTLAVSREYLALRYQTDRLLVNARSYDFDSWQGEVGVVLDRWEKLDREVAGLELSANELTEEKVSFGIIREAYAYDRQEISDVFDKAPAGKKIATLAKHLGVDAKTAFRILKQDQAQVEADAWNEAGDTFKKLEVSATLIKDGCKVAGFVGGIVATGGTSALAAGSTLAKATVIVGGADLSLEVTEDMANIALGDKNKISAIVGEARKVTEPIATILAINEIPNNLKTGFEKFSSAMVAVEQFKGAAQDGKIIGIQLPTASNNQSQFENIKKHKAPIYVSEISPADIDSWLEVQGIKAEELSQSDLETILGVLESDSKKTEEGKVVTELELADEAKTPEVGSEVESLDATSSDSVENSNGLSLVSPAGTFFTPESGLNFSARLSNPEAYMANGKNVAVWCVWKFYLNNELYTEKVNPSTIHPAVVNICEYSTLLMKDKGNLRVDFSLERGRASKYSEEKNKETMVQTSRKYIVK